MTAQIATVRGELILKIGDAEAVSLGYLSIPIEARTSTAPDGTLNLRATPNMREVRELIEQVFARAQSGDGEPQ